MLVPLAQFTLPSAQLALVMLLTIIMTFMLSGAILVVLLSQEEQRRRAEMRAARACRLRYLHDEKEVHLETLRPHEDLLKLAYPSGPPSSAPRAGPFHIFLSHNWQHGQNAMRIVKSKLREMLPDVEVFLGAPRRLSLWHLRVV
jgi:hypothetical protein